MEESKTLVTVVDETIGLSADPVDTGVNILCPIISPSGPVKLTKVTGPTQLKNYFNAGKQITPASEQTLKYARAVIAKGPVYIKRASRNLLKGGITFGKYPSAFYVDQQDNVVEGKKIKLSLNLSDTADYATLIKNIDDSETAYVKLSDTTYVAVESFIDSKSLVLESMTSFTPSNILCIDQTADLEGNVVVGIGGVSYTFTAGSVSSKNVTDQLKGFVEAICKKTASDNPIGVYGTDMHYICYGDEYASGFDPDSSSLKALAFGSKIDVKYDSENDSTKIYVKSTDNYTAADNLYLYTVKSKSDYEDSYQLQQVDFSLTFDAGSGEEKVQVITDNNDSEEDADYVIEIPKGTTYSDFMAYVIENLNTYTTADTCGTDSIVLVNGTNATSKSNSEIAVSVVSDFKKPNLDEFGIVAKFPNEGKVIDVILNSITEDGLYNPKEISVEFAGITEDWTFSLEAGAVDGYGNDISYKKVNQESELIDIIPLGGVSSVEGSASIGNEITADHLGTGALIAALEYIQEYEESPVNFDYILDGGVIDSSYSEAILSACETYCSFYPASCQTEKVTKSTLKSNRSRVGSNYRANMIGATQVQAVLDSGIDTFPGSFYYISKRLELAPTVQEFVPLFGISNGDIGISSPAVSLKKSDREELLDNQIMTLRQSMTTGSYYLNDDLTLYKTDSYLQEASIVLMVNTICHIAMNYAETLKGQFNTSELRDKTANALTTAITNRLRVGTQNGPDSITVVCNNVNNPVSLQNQRKLRIDIYGRFNRSIKDVLIYTYVQPLEE